MSPSPVALVTGASSGIGAATARALFDRGHRVVLCGRRTGRLQGLAAELDPSGERVHPAPVDLRDEAAILAMWEGVRTRWGGVDVLVNNAGLGRDAPLRNGRTDAWREMLDVNVLALCICTREALADMERRGVAGHVVHISSMAGHRVPLGSGVYSATKYAVRSLTEGLRQELRAAESPIRVTAISPGVVETEFKAVFQGVDPATPGLYDFGMAADDVARSVVHAVTAPPGVEIHDILMRPTTQVT